MTSAVRIWHSFSIGERACPWHSLTSKYTVGICRQMWASAGMVIRVSQNTPKSCDKGAYKKHCVGALKQRNPEINSVKIKRPCFALA